MTTSEGLKEKTILLNGRKVRVRVPTKTLTLEEYIKLTDRILRKYV